MAQVGSTDLYMVRVVLVEEWESAADFKAYIGSYSDEDNANMMKALTSAPNFVILNEVG